MTKKKLHTVTLLRHSTNPKGGQECTTLSEVKSEVNYYYIITAQNKEGILPVATLSIAFYQRKSLFICCFADIGQTTTLRQMWQNCHRFHKHQPQNHKMYHIQCCYW